MSIMRIPSFDEYSIDTHGLVWNNNTSALVTSFVNNGKRCVNLYRLENGKRVRKLCYVSRLMAETYMPDYSESCAIIHIDGDNLNDDLDNLACASRSDALKRRRCNTHPLVLDETTGELFSTYAEAARSVGGHRNGVYLCAIGIQSSHKGHVFRYAKKN